MNDLITRDKLEKYIAITREALRIAKKSGERLKITGARADVLDMVSRYLDDAVYFMNKHYFVNAFACVNYAHGWLDAGARIGIFDVHDSSLFTVDSKE